MGLESRCEVRWQGNTWQAAVHLDSIALEVRGRPRFVLPLKQIRGVHAVAGELQLDTDDGRLTLLLGADAATWARKIQAPPSRLAKLGVSAELRVGLVGLGDAEFRAELDAVGAKQVARGKADAIFFGVEVASELAQLVDLRERIAPDGAVWVLRAKGKGATVKESEVREAARAAGLVDVKVAAFSETHTADKLVIPAAHRERPASRKSAAGTTKPAAASKSRASQQRGDSAPGSRAGKPASARKKRRPLRAKAAH